MRAESMKAPSPSLVKARPASSRPRPENPFPGSLTVVLPGERQRLLDLHLDPDLAGVRTELLTGEESPREEVLGLLVPAGFHEGERALQDQVGGQRVGPGKRVERCDALGRRPAHEAEDLIERLVDLDILGIDPAAFAQHLERALGLVLGMKEGQPEVAVKGRDRGAQAARLLPLRDRAIGPARRQVKDPSRKCAVASPEFAASARSSTGRDEERFGKTYAVDMRDAASNAPRPESPSFSRQNPR